MIKYVLNFNEWLNEAISIKQAKKYTKAWPKEIKHRLDDVFGLDEKGRDRNRLYFPLGSELFSSKTVQNSISKEVAEYLDSIGYEIEDYKAGYCKKIDSEKKNIVRIGKILSGKDGNSDLLKKFNEDTSRALVQKLTKEGGDLVAVISRHPVDIAGMTSGRKWEKGSCMNIEKGVAKKYVIQDVKEGVLIAYLIKDDDKNIQNPISRLLIQPYINVKNDNDLLYVPMKQDAYGVEDKDFRELINNWLDSWQSEKTGIFKFNCNLYQDRSTKYIFKNSEIGYYIDENGDVDLRDQNLKELPDLSNIKGINNFNCAGNKLKTLKGAPKEVGGDFNCIANELESLKGAPKKVGKNFSCSRNKLKSLEGAPKEVGWGFDCNENELESLEGAPKDVGGIFNCKNNKTKFTKEDIIKFCNVKEEIRV